MSSPVHLDKDLDISLTYAPPWAREQGRSSPAASDLARIEWPPPARRLDGGRLRPNGDVPFSGDVAILQLKRQLSLNPDIVPQPPLTDPTNSAPGLALRICAVVAVAALIAFAVTMLSLPGMKRALTDTASAAHRELTIAINPTKEDRWSTGRLLPRLVVRDGHAAVNEPLNAGIQLEGDAAGAMVVLSGLAPQSRLSAGTALGANGWRVAGGDLRNLLVHAPQAFAGRMDVALDLRSADDRILDSQVARFVWGDAAKSADAVAKPNTAAAADAQVRALHLEPDEMATLLKRSEEALKNGDVSAARLLLRRAAFGGSASAAVALGATYDPLVIHQIGAVGAIANTAKAREWYKKAAQLGSPVASQRLEQLTQTGR